MDRALSDRFGSDLDFGPIRVDEKLDQDGDPYLHILTVFDGDQSQLNPAWTSRIMGRIRPELMEIKSYLEYLGPGPAGTTIQFLTNDAVETGEAFGSEYAIPVELVLIN